eukprot:scaffold5664_cov115-Isochrysis_galbana.AAC.9
MERSAEAVSTRASASQTGSTDHRAASWPLRVATHDALDRSHARAVLSHEAEKSRPLTCEAPGGAGTGAQRVRPRKGLGRRGWGARTRGDAGGGAPHRTGAHARDDVRVALQDVRRRRRLLVPHDDVLVVRARHD